MGCLLTVKLLGIIVAKQTEDGDTCRNDRLIGRIAQSRMYADLNELDDLGHAMVDELSRFFVAMNELKGNRFEVKGIADAAEAVRLVTEAGRRASGCAVGLC